MNLIVERDIAHVGRVMRASTLSCAPELMLVDYWRGRLLSLLGTDDLTEFQLYSLHDLMAELAGIEKQLEEVRAERPRYAAAAHG
ncbi:hypothetical protein [Paraburkholderia sp. DHOC27]|uniref:hypothetical protein n=1 Tax=Paraburkholderia sp. DHOC27 TaxID=2303330 RepID=UPI000E3D2678|nr:hypothetical protein [Paraburkholderia sp. DHOC27]RFU49748.1 hypothetical protein D0B32_08245 [Paraburkholderia sp. DHOC27]